MRSSLQGLSTADLSTRARLREAAIARFARDGFGASLRAIAADAGLSAASVIKHFGSKEGLRAACDEHVFSTIRASKREVLAGSAGPAAFLAQMAKAGELGPLVAYVLRSLQDGGEHARAFVDQVVADAVEYIAEGVAAGRIVPSRDEQARARYLVEASFGALMLEVSLNPLDDPEDVSGALERYQARLALPALELFTDGLLADRRMLDAYLLYVGDPPGGVDGSLGPGVPTEHEQHEQESDDGDIEHAGRR